MTAGDGCGPLTDGTAAADGRRAAAERSLTLYQTEWCAYSHRVRQVMTELCITYTCVNVAPSKEGRAMLLEVSGQDQVPVLTDGGLAIVGSDAIIAHLRSTFAATPYSERQARGGTFRYVKESAAGLEDTLRRLRESLIENRLATVSEARLPAGDAGEYHLLQVASPVVVKSVAATDPATVGALTVQIGLWPTEQGCAVSVIDPVAGAWLTGRPETLMADRKLRERVKKVFDAL